MKWYDYVWITPIAIIVATIAIPHYFLEVIMGILDGAREATSEILD